MFGSRHCSESSSSPPLSSPLPSYGGFVPVCPHRLPVPSPCLWRGYHQRLNLYFWLWISFSWIWMYSLFRLDYQKSRHHLMIEDSPLTQLSLETAKLNTNWHLLVPLPLPY